MTGFDDPVRTAEWNRRIEDYRCPNLFADTIQRVVTLAPETRASVVQLAHATQTHVTTTLYRIPGFEDVRPYLGYLADAFGIYVVKSLDAFALEQELPEAVDTTLDRATHWLDSAKEGDPSESFSNAPYIFLKAYGSVRRFLVNMFRRTRSIWRFLGNTWFILKALAIAMIGVQTGSLTVIAGALAVAFSPELLVTAAYWLALYFITPSTSEVPRPPIELQLRIIPRSRASHLSEIIPAAGPWSDRLFYDATLADANTRIVFIESLQVTPLATEDEEKRKQDTELAHKTIARVLWRLQDCLTRHPTFYAFLVVSQEVLDSVTAEWVDRLQWHDAWFMPAAETRGNAHVCWLSPQTRLVLAGRHALVPVLANCRRFMGREDVLPPISGPSEYESTPPSESLLRVAALGTTFTLRELTDEEYQHAEPSFQRREAIHTRRHVRARERASLFTRLFAPRFLAQGTPHPSPNGFFIDARALRIDNVPVAVGAPAFVYAIHALSLVYGYVVQWLIAPKPALPVPSTQAQRDALALGCYRDKWLARLERDTHDFYQHAAYPMTVRDRFEPRARWWWNLFYRPAPPLEGDTICFEPLPVYPNTTKPFYLVPELCVKVAPALEQ